MSITLYRPFFQLLRAGLFGKPADSRLFLSLGKGEWEEVFRLSMEQAVAGVVWDGVLMLPEELQPHKLLWYKWLGVVLQIERENERLNGLVPEIMEGLSGGGILLEDGVVPVALLKGQGTGALYRNLLHRSSGDVDVYAGKYYGLLERYMQCGENGFERVGSSTKHVEYMYKGVMVENHRYVALFFCPWLAWRLRRLEREWFPEDLRIRSINGKEMLVAPPWFEALFGVIHFRAHLHLEGVGWRQLCDWWLIRQQLIGKDGEAIEQCVRYERGLRQLGLVKMEAMMREVFEKMIIQGGEVEELSKMAKQVYKEMMSGGNFGHHAEDAGDHSFASQRGYWRTLWNLLAHDVERGVRFFSLFPGEAVFSPLFRIGGYIRRRGR